MECYYEVFTMSKLIANPQQTYALVVGIEKYKEEDFDIDGPVNSAFQFAQWLTKGGVPSENIQLCLSPIDKNRDLVKQCPVKVQKATRQHLSYIINDILSQKSGDLLYIFWAGHGVLISGEKRRLICAEATRDAMYSIDVSSLLLLLASTNFQIRNQICLIDACAEYAPELRTDSEEFFPGAVTANRQFVLFSSREGETAKVNTDTGMCFFSEIVLDLLVKEPHFLEDIGAFAQKVIQKVDDLGKDQRPTFWQYRSLDGDRDQEYDLKSSPPENLPRRGKKEFVGRLEVLEDLHKKLQTKGVATTAIVGMGGVGKTELALQYAHNHWRQSIYSSGVNSYPGGFCWFRIQEDVEVGTEIVNFARNNIGLKPPDGLDLHDQVKHCWKHWKGGDVLIVFDDVNESKQIEAYLPPEISKFKVLFTTRNQNLAENFQRLSLDVLSEAAALELLVSRIGEQGEQRINQEIGQAKLLCKDLGFLPLALELVGRYLSGKQDRSLKLMRKQLAEKLLEDRSLKPGKYDILTAQRGVKAAFELSWKELNQEKQAQELGYVLSIFALAPIPWYLVEQCLRDRNAEDLEDFRDDFLVNFSLLQRTGENTYQLHQLIREFLISKEEKIDNTDELKRDFCQVMLVVAQDIPQDPTIQIITAVTPAIPHLAEAATKLKNFFSDEDLTWPFSGLSRFYEGQGAYGQALPWREQSLSVARKRLGEEHPSVATSLNNLAYLYESQGRYDKAEPLYVDALAMRKRLLGEEHPDVATSLNNLAGLYESQGRYDKAEPLYVDALAMKKRLLGEEHPSVAISLNNLASLYQSLGRYDKAEPLYVDALAMRKRLLGEEHPDVASSLNSLASLYYSQGRYDKAEPLFVDALAMRKRLLGEEHPSVATSLNNLAVLYKSLGRYDKAEPLFVDALAMRKRLLGEEHPDIASSLNNLAGLYESQGRYDKAEPLYVDALAMIKRLLGEEHPDVASSLNNLAVLYDSQGRYDKAEPLYVDALAMRKRLLGEEHPDVASSLNNLAGLYDSQGRYDKAEPLYVDALAMRKRLLGEEHPSVATSLNNLALLYDSLGRYSDAEPLYKKALETAELTLGVNHPNTITIRQHLASLGDHRQSWLVKGVSFLKRIFRNRG